MTTTYRPDCFDAAAIKAGLPFATVNVVTDEVTGRFGTAEAAEAFIHDTRCWATTVVSDVREGVAR